MILSNRIYSPQMNQISNGQWGKCLQRLCLILEQNKSTKKLQTKRWPKGAVELSTLKPRAPLCTVWKRNQAWPDHWKLSVLYKCALFSFQSLKIQMFTFVSSQHTANWLYSWILLSSQTEKELYLICWNKVVCFWHGLRECVCYSYNPPAPISFPASSVSAINPAKFWALEGSVPSHTSPHTWHVLVSVC